MTNQITLMGRLTRDPQLQYTKAGLPFASFTLACDRDHKNADGEKQTDFIDCVAWRGTAEIISKYLAKGSMAVVSGRLQVNDWTDRDGNKRRSADVLVNKIDFADSHPRAAGPAAASRYDAEDSGGLPF